MTFPRRSIILLSAFAMQLCLGATYSWSVFVRPLRELTGLTQSEIQLPFTVFYLAFPATMLLAGVLLRHLGPRVCALIGGILFGSGWLLASFGSSDFTFTVLGIGLLAGIGVGFAYVVPIAVLVQWFPDRKGLVTGIAVAGFGGGAALISHTAGGLLLAGTTTPFALFAVYGVVFMVVILVAALPMRFPVTPKHPDVLSVPAILTTRAFRILYAAMVTGLAAGFAVNANLKELSASATAETAIAAVSLFAVANAAGRIVWGFVADRVTVTWAVVANLLLQSAVLGLSVLLLDSRYGIVLFALLTGFNYGGVLVVYASSVARLWGAERVGQVYGLLFSANILASPAPIFAGWIYDATGGVQPALMALVFLMVTAAIPVVRGRKTLDTITEIGI